MDTQPQDARDAFPPSTALALTSLVLGIAAIGLSFLLVGFIVGLAGIGFAYAHLGRKKGPTTMAFWGMGLSILGVVASLGFGGLYFYFVHQAKSTMTAGGPPMATGGAMPNVSSLPAISSPLKSNLDWTVTIPGAQALCTGDWESDGGTRVLVAEGSVLNVLDLTGTEISKVPVLLPGRITTIECGRNKAAGARLLAYSTWSQQVMVFDHTGKKVWNFAATEGVDGAHWGDLNGDGDDEMIVGMNGSGGLEAVSANGKKLWSASMGNVWCQAIVPAATNRPALVVATEAGGSVNLFDAEGQRQTVLRPSGGYFTEVAARAVDNHSIQILAFADNAVVAFDTSGNVAWTSSALPDPNNTRRCCAAGDFKGDGSMQWVFLDGAGDLVLATTDGKKAGWIPNQGGLNGFAVAPRPGRGDLLLTQLGATVHAYSWKE